MGYYTKTYYSKNANGRIVSWFANVLDSGKLVINTGILNNKQRVIINDSITGKNIGKSNSTTKYGQAVKEAMAKARKKVKDGYKLLSSVNPNNIILVNDNAIEIFLEGALSINKTDANNVLKPMKAVSWQDNKFNYPAICQPKINGHRNTAMLVKDIEGMFASGNLKVKLLTKSGHEYVLPHISDAIPYLWFDGNTVFDGEVYVHNEILSQIKRRLPMRKIGSDKVSKNSLPTAPVTFMIFDLSIPDIDQLARLDIKDNLLKSVPQLYYCENGNKYRMHTPIDAKTSKYITSPIVNVQAVIINSDKEAKKHLIAALDSGYEGIVLRDLDAEYMFGSRKINMMKRKGLKHSEFKIVNVVLKNKDSVRTYVDWVLKNDINDKVFETPVQGNQQARDEALSKADYYIGKRITLGFPERTINGIPFHIKTAVVREEWDMDKDDLNIEL